MHITSGPLNPDDVVEMPNPSVGSQLPVFAVSKVEEDPFTSAIPCTSACPITTTPSIPAPSVAPTTTATTTTSVYSRSSVAMAPARATGHFAGAALGIVGLGAGMALL